MNEHEPTAESLDLVAAAIGALPGALERALRVPLPLVDASGSIVTSGIGASEGPARLLAHRLARLGVAARFVHPGEFVTGQVRADHLIAFSQGLSPNARLAFTDEHRFRSRLLVTSIGYDGCGESKRPVLDALVARGITPLVVPPGVETGTLVRFVGPTVAALVALRLAGLFGDTECLTLSDAPNVYADASARSLVLPDDPGLGFAVLGAGVSIDELFAPRWKLLETLLIPDPPAWDALSFAHGPVQAALGHPLALLGFETPRGEALADRLARSIDRDHHRLVRFRSKTDGPLAFIEHAALLDAALLAALRVRPRDLFSWPGRGNECALYALGEDPT